MVLDEVYNRLFVCGDKGWWTADGGATPCNEQDSCTVFVTSRRFTGDLVTAAADLGLGDFTGQGLKAGDFICNWLARDAGLQGAYTAWLSDSNVDVKDRITNATVPYRVPDGTQVADDFADVLDCGDGSMCLDSPINQDEYGTTLVADLRVWTGTVSDGTATSITCADWTADVDDDGFVGEASFVSGSWTLRGCGSDQCACELTRRLYCFQD